MRICALVEGLCIWRPGRRAIKERSKDASLTRSALSAALLALFGAASGAAAPALESADEAIARDSAEYARRHAVAPDEAARRLRAQEESVAATDRIAQVYRARLAGITIEHGPQFRIIVLLTGTAPVSEQRIRAGGMEVPILFETGARATGAQIVNALVHHRDSIRSRLPGLSGMGLDPRTGELALMVKGAGLDLAERDRAIEALTGVPVRIRMLDRDDRNLSVEGGARVVGIDPTNGRRSACTTGFVVASGPRSGIVTAAHCPDALTYQGPDGEAVELAFEGQWGWRYQDVQVNLAPSARRPLFYSDTAKTRLRTVSGARARSSIRGGDFVCRRGETSGYSCAEIDLVDYAPPGDLCGGPCDPVWVTVPGPSCRGGDSGAPVFAGTIAFGIVKGGNYGRDGTCNFYYFMSTDYLPSGWGLLRG